MGWQTKNIMACYGIFWSGQLLCVPGNRKSRDMVRDYAQSPAGQE